jgi:hypothetical protein
MASNRKMIPPSSAQLKKYGVNVPDSVVAISQPLYHYQVYAAAGQTQLTFFQNPVGQNGLTFADTNVEAAGSMPSPKRMLVTGIQVQFFPGSLPGTFGAGAVANNWNDMNAVYQSGWLDFFVGSASWLKDAPIGKFPPDYRLAGTAAMSDSTTAAAAQANMVDYAAMAGRPYDITPIELSSNQNFNVTLNWPAVVATPSTVAGRIGVTLMGFQYRLSQ